MPPSSRQHSLAIGLSNLIARCDAITGRVVNALAGFEECCPGMDRGVRRRASTLVYGASPGTPSIGRR